MLELMPMGTPPRVVEETPLGPAGRLIERKWAWLQGDIWGGDSLKDAERFCAVGAMLRIYGYWWGLWRPAWKVYRVMDPKDRGDWGWLFPFAAVSCYNDTHTHAEVIALMRKAGV